MYIYIYTCIHTHTYIHMYIYIDMYIYLYTHTHSKEYKISKASSSINLPYEKAIQPTFENDSYYDTISISQKSACH